MATRTGLAVAAAVVALMNGCASAAPQPAVAVARRALIVSIDGLHPDLLHLADVPTIRGLMAQGAFTLRARTIDTPYTVPAHVSMLTGVAPETHGVTWNHHIEEAYPHVPTLLELARRAGGTTALVVGKSKLIVLTKPGTLHWSHVGDEIAERDADIAGRAAGVIRRHRPEVMFVHLGDVDAAGHASGWGSAAQLAAVGAADVALGRLVRELESAELMRSTVVVVTADHGGLGFDHLPGDGKSSHVPWIVAGPSIRRNFDIDAIGSADVSITATFSLIRALLGLDFSHPADSDFPRAILEP